MNQVICRHILIRAFLAMSACLFSLSVAAFDCAKPLVRVGADGAVTAGSKDSLIAALNAGKRVRISWRLGPPEHRLVHWADPIFISIFHGNVFAQLPAIHVQRGRGSTKSIELYGDKAQNWYGLISTDGQLSGRSGESGKIESVGIEQAWCESQ